MTPRAAGIACLIASTLLGVAYMAAAGAPTAYLVGNALSLVLGLGLLAVIPRKALDASATFVVLGGLLLATALFGATVDGANRWVPVGAVFLQTSLIVLPLMLVAFARTPGAPGVIGMIVAAAALALQPDRAMAGVMVAALAMLALYRRERIVGIALTAAAASFVVTVVRPDALPAVPYVDQILYTSFQVHPLAGIAVTGGSLLLIVPALVGMWRDPDNRPVHAVFAAVWLGLVVAAALGNYPTPIVGFGGSSILGYAIPLAGVPNRARSLAGLTARAKESARLDPHRNVELRIGLAP